MRGSQEGFAYGYREGYACGSHEGFQKGFPVGRASGLSESVVKIKKMAPQEKS